ncbi:MAG: VOC family protein [Saprospiraceae bacterium]
MHLGAFSISLSVKNLAVSKSFYENLGFEVFAGDADKRYYIMKNGRALIGLFEGMFEGNLLTFNPGWDENASPLDAFTDVRDIQRHLQQADISLIKEANLESTGPEHISLVDPDGNVILIDQHR